MQSLQSLPAELSIYTVAELHPQWLGWLSEASHDDGGEPAASEAWQLDGAAVAEVDAAGVQLLVALSNALARQHRLLQIVNPSQVLQGACTGLGAQSLLVSTDVQGDPQ